MGIALVLHLHCNSTSMGSCLSASTSIQSKLLSVGTWETQIYRSDASGIKYQNAARALEYTNSELRKLTFTYLSTRSLDLFWINIECGVVDAWERSRYYPLVSVSGWLQITPRTFHHASTSTSPSPPAFSLQLWHGIFPFQPDKFFHPSFIIPPPQLPVQLP